MSRRQKKDLRWRVVVRKPGGGIEVLDAIGPSDYAVRESFKEEGREGEIVKIFPRAKKNPAFDKEALRKDIARDQRRAARATRTTLESELRAARAARRRESAAAKARCKSARGAARARFADARKVRDEARAKKEAARGVCDVDTSALRARELEAKKKRDDEVKFQRDMRRIERGNRARAASSRASDRERASESDDEVRGNIPADLVPLFNRVRRQIRGSARISRTEAFMKYVEEHPREVTSSVSDETDAEVDRLVAELREREARENPACVAVDPRHGAIVSLGLLTRIETNRGGFRWSLRSAPVLGYHVCTAGSCEVKRRLVIVARARSAKGVAPTTKEARREYARAHWGKGGTRPTIPGRVYGGGPVRFVGIVTSVTYTTEKGDDAELTDYEHAFEGARPILARSSDGLLVICGGSYRIETRGIVG